MEPAPSVYSAFPLDDHGEQIRLLRLIAGKWDDPIKCKILTASVKYDVPEYHALSYVWGSPIGQHTVSISGIGLKITTNLFEALRRIRAHYQDTILLWIDAICINQFSTIERNHQVGLMGSVYAKASEVLVWLGELDTAGFRQLDSPYELETCYHFSGDVFDFTTCAQDYQAAFDFSEDEQNEVHVRPQAIASMSLHIAWMFRVLADQQHLVGIPPFSLDDSPLSRAYFNLFFEGIEFLADNPWFERLWVVQEAVLAKRIRVMFGTVSLPWDMLVAGMRNFWKHTPAGCCLSSGPLHYELRITIRSLLQQFANLDHLRQNFQHGHAPAPRLFDLCLDFLTRKTSEDIDRIYALLGMQSFGRIEGAMTAHYEADAGAVYTDVVRDYICEAKSLLPLAFTGIRNKYCGIPSWAVDFTAFDLVENQIMETWSCIGPYFKLWSASLIGPCPAAFEKDDLHASAVMLDDIVVVSPILSPGTSLPDLGDWRELVLTRFSPEQSYSDDCKWSEAWLRTLCADCCWGSNSARRITRLDLELLSKRAPSVNLQANQQDVAADKASVLPTQQRRDSPSIDETDDEEMFTLESGHRVPLEAHFNDILRMVHAMTFRRRLCITKGGMMGVGNGSIASGDHVGVVDGAPTPLILRPCKALVDTGDILAYALLGCAYVHGIMDMSYEELSADFADRRKTVIIA